MPEYPEKPPMGGALANLIAGIDLDLSKPASEAPHAIRRRLQVLLESPELYLDCAELLLFQMVCEPSTRVLFSDSQSRYTLQLFCWPPGFGNEPHLHTNWNVSAVMAQSLLVFRSTLSQEDCRASKPLVAACGQAGVLIPPQFHCLRNPGEETAITFHVFSVDKIGDERGHLERRPASGLRLDDHGILAIATLAARHPGPRAIGIVRTAFAAAGNSTKLDLLKLMVKLDPVETIRMGRVLSELVGGEDGRRLLEVLERLDAAASRGAL
jgi:hypothetical protein